MSYRSNSSIYVHNSLHISVIGGAWLLGYLAYIYSCLSDNKCILLRLEVIPFQRFLNVWTLLQSSRKDKLHACQCNPLEKSIWGPKKKELLGKDCSWRPLKDSAAGNSYGQQYLSLKKLILHLLQRAFWKCIHQVLFKSKKKKS